MFRKLLCRLGLHTPMFYSYVIPPGHRLGGAVRGYGVRCRHCKRSCSL